MKGAIRMLLNKKNLQHIFHSSKDAVTIQKDGKVAFPFKVDGKVVFFEWATAFN